MLKMRKESELEASLYVQIEQAGLPLPAWQEEIEGHKVDFVWGWEDTALPTNDSGVMVEVQGGTEGYGKGRGAHVREPGYSKDRMYSNRRQMEGWLVLEFTKQHVENGVALDMLREVLG
jgi:hypothetical protein